MENFRNPELRDEIKKRLEAELAMGGLPLHRKHEVEALLYLVKVYEEERVYLS